MTWSARFDFTAAGRIRLALFRDNGDGTELVARRIRMVPAKWEDPLPSLIDMFEEEGRDVLQVIVDACWKAGIKPSEEARG